MHSTDDMIPIAGVLARPEILAWMDFGRPWKERLVVMPFVQPTSQLGANTIDLRLGSEFLVTNHERIPSLDLTQGPVAIKAMLQKAHQYLRFKHRGKLCLA